jgi:hypothetical protein
MGTQQNDASPGFGETDRRDFRMGRFDTDRHRPTRRTMLRQSHRCNQTDGHSDTFSGHAQHCQNPVDLTKLLADLSVTYLTQDEPT